MSTRASVLVTGGAGFIGSHLVELLLEDGHPVVALDDLSTGRVANIQHLMGRPGFRFQPGSVLDRECCDKAVAEVDVVVHLAAAVGVKYILDHPIESLSVNIAGTEMLLDQAVHFRTRVFLASTSEVYGKQSGETLRENDDLRIGPTSVFRWSYACSKALDEFMALANSRTHGLPVVVGRLFNTVGPRQVGKYGMVIPRFVERALEGESIPVYGDGEQSRTFTHVKDAVDMIYRLVMSPAAWGQVFNISGPETVTINELARRVIRKTGTDSKIQFIPYDQVYGPDFEDIERRVPCLTKLRAVIGSVPTRGLDEILDAVIAEKRALREEAVPPAAAGRPAVRDGEPALAAR